MADDHRPESTATVEAARPCDSEIPHSAFPLPQFDLHDLYLEQQRRLACPGCGEEAFLG